MSWRLLQVNPALTHMQLGQAPGPPPPSPVTLEVLKKWGEKKILMA